MSKLGIATIATAMLLTAPPLIQATPYTFNFTGQDLMYYSPITTANNDHTPADIHLYHGAMRFTPTNGPVLTSWLASTSADFKNMAETSGYGLGIFNLWGFGDLTNSFGTANATAWGETFTVDAWEDTGLADSFWISPMITDAGTLGQTVLGYARTEWGDPISFQSTSTPNFSFTVDLPTTTDWLYGVDGQLVFWFGGHLVDNQGDSVGILQGNMVLTGTPVPEPTALLLLSVGLMGLAAVGRKTKKHNA